jgi:hypothetical protein
MRTITIEELNEQINDGGRLSQHGQKGYRMITDALTITMIRQFRFEDLKFNPKIFSPERIKRYHEEFYSILKDDEAAASLIRGKSWTYCVDLSVKNRRSLDAQLSYSMRIVKQETRDTGKKAGCSAEKVMETVRVIRTTLKKMAYANR